MDTETLDTNGDGFVDKEEFMLCARDAVDDRGEVVRSRSALFNYAAGLYDAIDIDGNGLLSSEELKYGRRRGGRHAARLCSCGLACLRACHIEHESASDGGPLPGVGAGPDCVEHAQSWTPP